MMFIEKVWALKSRPPFDRLRNSELALIANIARERSYAPGERIASEGALLQRLYIVTRGSVHRLGGEAVPVLGLLSLLYEEPAKANLLADATEGATCLIIGKNHFFTIIHECPELLIGLLETPDFERHFL